jgi:hypothetical protein
MQPPQRVADLILLYYNSSLLRLAGLSGGCSSTPCARRFLPSRPGIGVAVHLQGQQSVYFDPNRPTQELQD